MGEQFGVLVVAIERAGRPRPQVALKVGELSPVVETSVGFHLIRVSARTPGTPAAFDRCVEDVRDAYADDFRAGLLPRLRREGQVQLTVP